LLLSLKPDHLKRYKDVAALLFKYGRRDMVERAGLAELLPEEAADDKEAASAAASLADDVEKLGPTYVKLGQLLSTRPDILPPAYAESLERLQNECEPFAYADAERILQEELGVRLSKAFREIGYRPVAAASLSQVHRARLRDGREVALKIQRPGIREQVVGDLETLGEIVSFLQGHSDFGRRYDIAALFEEFRKSMLRELDFRQEALHLVTIGRALCEIPEIIIPQPVMDYTTSRVLTMDFLEGTKITQIPPVAKIELDGGRLVDALFRAYLKQMLRDGLFHADPHPGNVLLVDGRIGMIDLGMVSHIGPGLQDRLLQLLLAIGDSRSEDAARSLYLIGECNDDSDQKGFERAVADLVEQNRQLARQRPQVGRTVLMLLKVAADHGVRLPPELAMIGKTLLNLDKIGQTLAPDFDPNAAIRRHAADITQEQVGRGFSLGSLFSSVVELKNFLTHLPGRVNRILDRLADNDFKVKVDAIDESTLMDGMQKVANRVATGLILAALIVGAALMMRVETQFQLFGYPGVAIILFLFAAAGGIALVGTILLNDIKSKPTKRKIAR
jgi:predicted unusual protein kinase regulating ubiquinone biosynthesis (AarF/ABC1/UbiB family)